MTIAAEHGINTPMLRAAVLSALVIALLPAGAVPLRAEDGAATPQPATLGDATGLPLPRFVSLKRDEVNMRRGPGQEHPILWVYRRRHLPVEVVNEFETWRKVRDIQGDEGWILDTMLSGERFVMVVQGPDGRDPRWPLLRRAQADAPIVAVIEPGVIAELLRCPGAYCEVRAGKYTGWMDRAALYGVYANETIN